MCAWVRPGERMGAGLVRVRALDLCMRVRACPAPGECERPALGACLVRVQPTLGAHLMRVRPKSVFLFSFLGLEPPYLQAFIAFHL